MFLQAPIVPDFTSEISNWVGLFVVRKHSTKNYLKQQKKSSNYLKTTKGICSVTTPPTRKHKKSIQKLLEIVQKKAAFFQDVRYLPCNQPPPVFQYCSFSRLLSDNIFTNSAVGHRVAMSVCLRHWVQFFSRPLIGPQILLWLCPMQKGVYYTVFANFK